MKHSHVIYIEAYVLSLLCRFMASWLLVGSPIKHSVLHRHGISRSRKSLRGREHRWKETGSLCTTHRSAGTTSDRYREAKMQREKKVPEVARLAKLVNVHTFMGVPVK